MRILPPWMPALLLSALTLGTFWVFRDFGPESALRRFHLASISGDVRTLNQVTDFEGGPAFALELQRRVRDIARIGGRYELRRVQRDRSTAVAQVVYRLPYRNQEIPSLWVVERGPGRWRVNPYRTIRLMERAFGVHP